MKIRILVLLSESGESKVMDFNHGRFPPRTLSNYLLGRLTVKKNMLLQKRWYPAGKAYQCFFTENKVLTPFLREVSISLQPVQINSIVMGHFAALGSGNSKIDVVN